MIKGTFYFETSDINLTVTMMMMTVEMAMADLLPFPSSGERVGSDQKNDRNERS